MRYAPFPHLRRRVQTADLEGFYFRSINPHVAPTLEAHQRKAAPNGGGGGRLATSAARQPGPTPLGTRSDRAISGISSFAFQVRGR